MLLNTSFFTFSGWVEDRNMQKEYGHSRVTFDKKTGGAVTVDEPRDKPESVSLNHTYNYLGLLRSS